MSIRFKLILLVVFIGAANVVSLIVRDIVTSPIEAIEAEQAYLDELGEALLAFDNHINRIDSEVFQSQVQNIEEAKRRVDEGFRGLDGSFLLARMNESIAASLVTLSNYQGDIDRAYTSFAQRLAGLEERALEGRENASSFILFELLSDQSSLRNDIRSLYSAAFAVHITVTNAFENLVTQRAFIATEIDAIEQNALFVVAVIVAGITIVAVFIGVLTTGRIARRIRAIEGGIATMKDGNLTGRIVVTSRDELGKLSGDVNVFTEALGTAMSRIKDESGKNVSTKEQLLLRVSALGDMIRAVDTETRSINGDMERLSRTVESSGGAVQTVESNVERLERVI